MAFKCTKFDERHSFAMYFYLKTYKQVQFFIVNGIKHTNSIGTIDAEMNPDDTIRYHPLKKIYGHFPVPPLNQITATHLRSKTQEMKTWQVPLSTNKSLGSTSCTSFKQNMSVYTHF